MVKDLDTVSVEFDDGITTITLDRPDQKNAISPKLIDELHDEVLPLVEEDARDPDGGSNVIVLTGSGDAFCGGMDLKKYFLANADDPTRMAELAEKNTDLFEELYRFPRPTIAAVNGWCFGGGLALLCCCDLAIAAEDATMGLSEVRWGIMPAGGATYLPAQTMARRDFLEASLMGREFDGNYADEIRLVNRAVPGEELMDTVYEWAEEMNQLNPTAVRYAKEAYIHEMENNMDFDSSVTYELARNRHLRSVTGQEDVKALQAFTDKKFKPGVETYSEEDLAEYDD